MLTLCAHEHSPIIVIGTGVAYTASKHGLIGLTKNTAAFYRLKGIRCNAICAGGRSSQHAGHDELSLKVSVQNARLQLILTTMLLCRNGYEHCRALPKEPTEHGWHGLDAKNL